MKALRVLTLVGALVIGATQSASATYLAASISGTGDQPDVFAVGRPVARTGGYDDALPKAAGSSPQEVFPSTTITDPLGSAGLSDIADQAVPVDHFGLELGRLPSPSQDGISGLAGVGVDPILLAAPIAVPEPAAFALLLTCLAMLGIAMRRRVRKAAARLN